MHLESGLLEQASASQIQHRGVFGLLILILQPQLLLSAIRVLKPSLLVGSWSHLSPLSSPGG